MQLFDILLLGGIAAWLFFSVRAIRRGKVSCGGCNGCGGNCSHCGHCAACAAHAPKPSPKV